MHWQKLNRANKISVAISSLGFAMLAFCYSLRFNIAPSYSDFVVGNLAWNATSKFQDFIVGPVFVITLFVSFLFLSKLLVWQEKKMGTEHICELSNQLVWWSIPIFSVVVQCIWNKNIPLKLVTLSLSGILYIIIIAIYSSLSHRAVNFKRSGLSLVIIILMAIIPFEIAIILKLSTIKSALGIDHIRPEIYETSSKIIFCFGWLAGLYLNIFHDNRLQKWIPKILLIPQLGLATLFLSLYPTKLALSAGTTAAYQTTVWLKGFILLMIAGAALDVIVRYKKYSGKSDILNLFSPLAVYALLISIQSGMTVIPSLSSDDFHFGENLLGSWLYLKGAVPYIDYFPVHGLIFDDLKGLLASLFYNGTANSYLAEASRTGLVILGIPIFFATYQFFRKNLIITFVTNFFLLSMLKWGYDYLFLTSFIALWFNPSLMKSPAKWLGVWLLTIPIIMLGVSGRSIAYIVPSGIIAVYFLWRNIRSLQKMKWVYVEMSLCIILITGIFTPLFTMLYNICRFLLEWGKISNIATSVTWRPDFSGESLFFFELTRMSWMLVVFILLTITYTSMKSKENKIPTILRCSLSIMIILLYIPYSMARIDPNHMSRPGGISFFSVIFLLPFSAWFIVKNHYKVIFLFFLACICIFYKTSFVNLVLNWKKAALSPLVSVNNLKNMENTKLHNIGSWSLADHNHLSRLNRLNGLLNKKLGPEETYLDLTNRNAQYFYMNRIPPTKYITSPYMMAPLPQQKREIKNLKSNPPPIALLEGDNILHDGGGLPLRSSLLYRFVVDNYIPAFEDGFIIGYRKQDKPPTQKDMVTIPVHRINDLNWEHGIHRRKNMILLESNPFTPLLKSGLEIKMGENITYQISRASGNRIFLKASSIQNLRKSDHPTEIKFAVGSDMDSTYRKLLFHKALGRENLYKIPVAWGRSEGTLKNKMTLVRNLESQTLNSTSALPEKNEYKITKISPKVTFDFLNSNLSGRDAGLLKFHLYCSDKWAEPSIKISWWGKEQEKTSLPMQLKFTASNGVLIVPLDASALWLTMQSIQGLELSFEGSYVCSTTSIRDIALYQRNSVIEYEKDKIK